jgi:small subunit ribosomal protein S7
MPRRKRVVLKRDIGVDLRYKSALLQKLINKVMERGKKDLARSIVYGAIDVLTKRSNGDEKKGYELFEKAIAQIRPMAEVKSRRVGGGVYQVPSEVRPDRALSLAYRWLLVSARTRSDKTMAQRLAAELLDAVEGRGGAVKKRQDVHRMAEANRAFSHYAW